MGLLDALLGANNKNDKKSGSKMGLFGEGGSPFDELLEKVTAEHLTSENWAMILDLCDKINMDPRHAKLALVSIKKRLNHRDPHVVVLALSVLDSCWSNCGTVFRKEVSSKAFVSELQSKCSHSMIPITKKTRGMIKKWVENECAKDPSLSLIETLYKDLKDSGIPFDSDEAVKKSTVPADPTAVASEEEEKAVMQAIALSLQDSERHPKATQHLYPTNGTQMHNGSASASNGISMYPSLGLGEAPSPQPTSLASTDISMTDTSLSRGKNMRKASAPPPSVVGSLTRLTSSSFATKKNRKLATVMEESTSTSERTVRALYDFEAAEDNEISFVTGDLITVTDDSNPNWWRGRIGVQQGLFPASFVTSDLSQIKPDADRSTTTRQVAVIDEATLLRCIQLLEDCDPTGETPDPAELAQVEAAAVAQAPLIDARLAALDRQSNALAQVDMAIRDVLALYDQAVQQAHYQASMYQPQQSNVAPIPQQASSQNYTYQQTNTSTVPNPQLAPQGQVPYGQYHAMPQVQYQQPTFQNQAEVPGLQMYAQQNYPQAYPQQQQQQHQQAFPVQYAPQ